MSQSVFALPPATQYPSTASQSYPDLLGYRVRAEIGGGGFSKVYRGRNSSKAELVAIKVIVAEANSVDKKLTREINVHRTLKHQNVLELVTSSLHQNPQNPIFKWMGMPSCIIVLEYAAGGDLFDKIAPDVGVSEMLAHYFFSQLIAGLIYIHERGVCHRDIKPENVLLDGYGNLKISDFGLCSVFKYKGKERTLGDACGTPPYAAPELALGEPYKAEPIDVWSAGILLFTLLVGNTPWDEPTKNSPEFDAYTTGELLKHDPWTRIDSLPLDLLTGLLCINPKNRLTLSQAQQHPWLAQPNAFLGADGKCTSGRRLASILMEQHNNNMLQQSQESSSTMLPPSRPTQTQNIKVSQRIEAELHPFSAGVAGCSAVSQHAPSTALDTRLTQDFSYKPLEELMSHYVQAISKAKSGLQTSCTPQHFEEMRQQEDLTVCDYKEILIGCIDARRQKLNGMIKFRAEKDSSDSDEDESDEDATMRMDKPKNQIYGYVITFSRLHGDPMEWKRLYQSITRQIPAGIIAT